MTEYDSWMSFQKHVSQLIAEKSDMIFNQLTFRFFALRGYEDLEIVIRYIGYEEYNNEELDFDVGNGWIKS